MQVTKPDIDAFAAKVCSSMEKNLMRSEVRIVDAVTGKSRKAPRRVRMDITPSPGTIGPFP